VPRELVVQLRKRANGAGTLVPVQWFSGLDLDFRISDPVDIGAGIEDVLKSLPEAVNSHVVIDLWRLAARAFRQGKRDDDAHRCQSMVAECQAAEAENAFAKQRSALLASHHLSAAIAELHGVPGKKDRRTELRHRLIDVQAHISEEMSVFSQEMELQEVAGQVQKNIKKCGLVDKLLYFASLAHSPNADDLVKQAVKNIQEHPLSSLFGASHLDSEGKVIHRTESGLFSENANDSAAPREGAHRSLKPHKGLADDPGYHRLRSSQV
jgi:hypothetical protein